MSIRPIDIVDVFVYLVVLGVFIQLFPYIISETFLLALLTAILLKVVNRVQLQPMQLDIGYNVANWALCRSWPPRSWSVFSGFAVVY